MITKLPIYDQRMLFLMEWAVDTGISANKREYLDNIGSNQSNMSNILNGTQSFTKTHIYNACKLTGASADYIFGFSNIILRKESKEPVELLRQAIIAITSSTPPNKIVNSKKTLTTKRGILKK